MGGFIHTQRWVIVHKSDSKMHGFIRWLIIMHADVTMIAFISPQTQPLEDKVHIEGLQYEVWNSHGCAVMPSNEQV